MTRNHVTRKTKAWSAVQIVMASCHGAFGCSNQPASDCASNSTCPPADATTDTASWDASWEEGGEDAESGSDVDGGVDGGRDAPSAGDGSPGDGSSDAGADGFDGYTCDPSQSPHDAPCVIDEAYGVFVAASANGGSDSIGNGTKVWPYATIGHAVAALAGRSRVYICNGSYAESVLLASSASLFGGLACPGSDAGAAWTYVGGRAEVASPSSDYALRVDAVGSPVAFEDFGFTSPNASGQDSSGNGKSSMAALIHSSTVTFRRCTLTAGAGDKGNDGTTSSNYPTGLGTGPDGHANDGGAGGSGGSIACSDGTSSTAGSGGSATLANGSDGGDGTANPMPRTYPAMALDGIGGAGGFRCGQGDTGADGVAGDGGVAATAYGTLTANGWAPSAGASGQSGQPGQGGGGGGGRAGAVPLGGTGGGAGGCGGAGGSGGKGGGASIALACIASTVTLEQCTLIAASAGNGGKGGDGQSGQGGGTYGGTMIGPCAGGTGGNGAGGAGGAGGTGGISVCMVYRGSAPVGSPNCMTGDAGSPGSGGSGKDGGSNALGSGPSGNRGADGLAGMAQPVSQVQ